MLNEKLTMKADMIKHYITDLVVFYSESKVDYNVETDFFVKVQKFLDFVLTLD